MPFMAKVVSAHRPMDIMIIAADEVTSRDLNPFVGLVCEHLCFQDGMDGLSSAGKQRALDTRRATDFLSSILLPG